ncbi:MAG: tetratricopeptide repeat protein [Leptolinea sp.]
MSDIRYFKDRIEAIKAFDRLWEPESGWILAYTGFSGHGKTTLLKWLEVNRCKRDRIPSARLSLGLRDKPDDDKEEDLASQLMLLIEQLRILLTQRTYQDFKKARKAILERLEQVRSSINQSMHVEDSEQINQSQKANANEIMREYERQAVRDLAEHWLDALDTIPKGERIVFLIDNYDLYQQRSACKEVAFLWLTLERAHYLLPGLRIVLASREELSFINEIQALQDGLCSENGIGLEPLSREDSDTLMSELGVKDKSFRKVIFDRLSKGHPLMTRMAAEAWVSTPGGITENAIPELVNREDVIDWLYSRILKNLPEPVREVVRWSALLRDFNAETLKAILGIDINKAFHEFTQFSFIQENNSRWKVHDLVRQAQIAYLQRENPSEFKEFQKKALDYYSTNGNNNTAIYHQFFVDPESAFENWQREVSKAAYQYNHPHWTDIIDVGLAPELQLTTQQYAIILFKEGERNYYGDNISEARSRYEEALTLFHTIGDRLGEANCIRSLGDVHVRMDELPEARSRYEEALTLFHTIGDRLGEANCIRSLGDVHVRMDELPEARSRYEEALTLFHTIGDRLGEANCIRSLGDVYGEEENIPDAITFLNKAMELYLDLELPHEVASILNNMANLSDKQKQYSQAIEFYSKAIQLFPHEAMWYRNRASIYFNIRDLEHTEEDLKMAEELQANHPYLFLRLGDFNLLKGRYVEAKNYFNKALKMMPRMNYAQFGLGRSDLLQMQTKDALAKYVDGLKVTNTKKELKSEIEELQRLIEEHPDLEGEIRSVMATLERWKQ